LAQNKKKEPSRALNKKKTLRPGDRRSRARKQKRGGPGVQKKRRGKASANRKKARGVKGVALTQTTHQLREPIRPGRGIHNLSKKKQSRTPPSGRGKSGILEVSWRTRTTRQRGAITCKRNFARPEIKKENKKGTGPTKKKRDSPSRP